jgi:hypothetical protein
LDTTGASFRILLVISATAAPRRVAAFANFDDSYQIDPDLSIKKCE